MSKLLHKIEDKLSGSHKHEAEHEGDKYAQQQGYSGSSGKTGGSENKAENAYAKHEAKSEMGGSGTGSRAQDLRHPVGSGAGGMTGSAIDRDGYGNQGYRSSQDPSFSRSGNGGVSNSMNDRDFHSGPQSSLENRDAIPTAGGREVGAGGQQKDHHYGRDALGAGSAAAGYEAYEHDKHGKNHHGHDDRAGAYDSRDNNRYDNGASNTAGPYQSNMANRLDPRVDSDQSRSAQKEHGQHHYGRDAALGTAGVGAYEHEHRKHDHGRSGDRNGGYGASRDDRYDNGPASSTAGPYQSNMANKLDPRVDSDQSRVAQREHGGQHHYGRDAAIGTAGTGAYEEERKHHGRHNDRSDYGTTGQSNYGSSGGPGGMSGSSYNDPASRSHHHHHQQQQPGMSGQGYEQQSGMPSGGQGGGVSNDGYDAGYQDAMQHYDQGYQKAMAKIAAEKGNQ